jgi:hypothetical protein
LSGANLAGANLSGAYLSGARLARANLAGTCLDIRLYKAQRAFVQACPPNKHGGRVVYRTCESQYVGNTEYIPGHTYVAPSLSFDGNTDCHPGIYAGILEDMRSQYPDASMVRCYVRDGDWVITRKGIRCKRLRILSKVE